jgi:hypothetical protein
LATACSFLPVALAGALAGAGCSPHAGGTSCDVGSTGAGSETDAGAYHGPYDVPLGPATTATLTGCGGPGYAAEFVVGAQSFQLTIDTGSGTLAVASSTCTSCGVAPTYAPGPGAVDDGQQVSDTYLAGSWQGEVYTDAVQVGTGAPVAMKLVGIDSQTAFFDRAGCGLGTVPFAPQGIAGFGPAELAVPGTDAFVTKLTTAPGSVPAVFAVEVCPQGGQLMLGGVDPVVAALTGPALYTPMTMSSYYDVALGDLRVGGASLGFGAPDFGPVAVDTGTSVLALPSVVFQSLVGAIEATPAFASAFGGKTGWLGTTTCLTSTLSRADMDAQLPVLTLELPAGDGGTTTLTRPATESYLPLTLSNGSTFYCSGIFANPLATGTILGTSAMLGQMVIFDLAGSRIGFAPQAFCR